MTLFDYLDQHPWWALTFLLVLGILFEYLIKAILIGYLHRNNPNPPCSCGDEERE